MVKALGYFIFLIPYLVLMIFVYNTGGLRALVFIHTIFFIAASFIVLGAYLIING